MQTAWCTHTKSELRNNPFHKWDINLTTWFSTSFMKCKPPKFSQLCIYGDYLIKGARQWSTNLKVALRIETRFCKDEGTSLTIPVNRRFIGVHWTQSSRNSTYRLIELKCLYKYANIFKKRIKVPPFILHIKKTNSIKIHTHPCARSCSHTDISIWKKMWFMFLWVSKCALKLKLLLGQKFTEIVQFWIRG